MRLEGRTGAGMRRRRGRRVEVVSCLLVVERVGAVRSVAPCYIHRVAVLRQEDEGTRGTAVMRCGRSCGEAGHAEEVVG